jgi:uncharacterized protein (TIGR03435 family)
MRGAPLIFGAFLGAAVLVAQAPRTFEVVSIKPNRSGAASTTAGMYPGGRWSMVNAPAATLIRFAYPAQLNELVGAPAWVSSDRWDVTAVAGAETTREEMRRMMQAMLADRFKLAVHYETRERDTYALVMARTDAQLGPDIRRSTLDCEAITAASLAGRPIEAPLPANGAPPCGMMAGGGRLALGGQSMEALARSISGAAGRYVVDRTGLTGNYEVTLRYAGQAVNGAERPAEELPSIFTALQEQLGLKLESDKAELRILVVDRIERPIED